jgi:hypothetical protein
MPFALAKSSTLTSETNPSHTKNINKNTHFQA